MNQGPTHDDGGEVSDRLRLKASTVYEIIRVEGEEELYRPIGSLLWSGLAAGLGIGASVYGQAFLHAALEGVPGQAALRSVGYSFGFLIVILGRLQLFTENTITAVLPLLRKPTIGVLRAMLRLWGLVLGANLVGAFLFAFFAVVIGVGGEEQTDAIRVVSGHLLDHPPLATMLRGIPAGFLVAAIVWMLPSSKGSEATVIIFLTSLIALGGFTHVIAGAAELFVLVLAGDVGFLEAIAFQIFPALVGNVVGGTGLFALLAYGQVAGELRT